MPHQDFINQITQRLIKTYNPLELYLLGQDGWEADEDPDDIDVKIIVQASAEQDAAKRAAAGYEALADLACEDVFLEVFTKDEFAKMKNDGALTFVLTQKYGKKIYERT